MVESGSIQIAAIPTAAKIKPQKAKKPTSKPNHPPTSQLVNAAIRSLKERNGSSLQAIKKYISQNNKVDADKLSPFIKKYLRNGTANGKLVQTKGKGANGSFKLPAKSLKANTEKKKKITIKKTGAKKLKTTKSKKSIKPKVKVAPKQKSRKPTAKKLKAPKPKKAQGKKPVTAAKKIKPAK